MSRRLFLTADDFGDNDAVNEAVVRAHTDGVLGFASLMVLRPAARQAAEAARRLPRLGLGLHLELCASAPEAAGLRYALDPRARAGLEGEIRAQFAAFRGLVGRAPGHVDGHMNIHVHPAVFPALCRVAREEGTPRVRLPGGEWRPYAAWPGRPRGERRELLALALFAMGRWVRGAATGPLPARAWGLLRSGLMSRDYVLWLLKNLPEGDTEIYFHPSADESLRPGQQPTPSHQSLAELELLLDPALRDAARAAGARLMDGASGN